MCAKSTPSLGEEGMLEAILYGIASLADPIILGYLIVGIFIGIALGILPGLSGLTGLAILTPLVFGMEPTVAFALLMGMYGVSPTGGSVTAILLNVPGEAPNAATILDGFPMTEQGHSGRALGIAFTASALGGLFGGLVLVASIPVLQPIVMAFESPERFIFVLIGISFIAVLGTGSPIKGLIAGGLGFLLSFVGFQGMTGFTRYAFGFSYLYDGIGIVPVALGLFAVPQAIDLMATGAAITKVRHVAVTTRSDLLQGCKDVFDHWWLFLRSAIIGTVVGMIPGLGGTVASWIAYGHAKQTSKHPEKFGTGYVEGVLAPESSNNAKEGGGLIPTLAFGIPGSGSMAILLGAFLILGIDPGPFFIRDHLNLVFALVTYLIASNILGAVILFLASGQLARIAFVRGHIVGPLILILVAIGAYSVERDVLDVFAALIVGGLGYVMRILDYSRPAFFLGFILGLLAERYFHISLEAYGWLFFTQPISLVLLVIAILSFSFRRIVTLPKRKAGMP